LVGATLLMQSLRKIRTISPGFSTTRVFDTSIPLTTAGYDVPRAKTFQDEVVQRVRALPGVEAAAYARVVPLGYEPYSSTPIAVDGYEPQPNERPTADYNEVSPEYFATLGIPLISGREFTRADDENAPRVAVVNQTMVARYWVLRLVLSRGLLLTTTGMTIGTAVALLLTRLLGNVLYQISPRDPLAFTAAFALTAFASVGACLLPAWRAARLDPVQALRHE
jgi:MacB-like periplasmic core domain